MAAGVYKRMTGEEVVIFVDRYATIIQAELIGLETSAQLVICERDRRRAHIFFNMSTQ